MAHVVHTEWSDGFGGQEQRILLECLEMERRGHRTTVVCRPGAMIGPKAAERGLHAVAIPIRSAFDPSAVAAMVRFFRRERATVVNTHSGKDSWAGSIAAKIARVPLLVRTRHISLPVRKSFFNAVWRWPDGFVTTGEKIREHLIGIGVPPDRIVSIPTGVDGDRFSPAVSGEAVRRELGLLPGQRVIASIGVLRGTKRVDLFVDVAARLFAGDPSLRFLIVGEGPKEAEIRGLIDERGLTDAVRLLGHRPDIPEILAATDVMVMTSVKEGLPQVVLQALAAGRPVVASPVGAIPEVVVDGETGLLCPPGDAEAFAQAVRRLLDDPASGARLGEAGRRVVLAKHSVAAMGERTEGFYRRLAAEKGVDLG